jgi:hypothetical protein
LHEKYLALQWYQSDWTFTINILAALGTEEAREEPGD